MHTPESFFTITRDASKYPVAGFKRAQQFRIDYYMTLFPGVAGYEISDFVNETNIMNWRDPNHSVSSNRSSRGHNRQRQGQSFARPKITVAYDKWNELTPGQQSSRSEDGYVGHARAADNASSHPWAKGPLGVMERWAKLHTRLGLLTDSRYRAVSEIIGEDQTVVDRLISQVLAGAGELPVVVYTYEPEEMVRETLANNGLAQNTDFRAPPESALHLPSLNLTLLPIQYVAPSA